VRYWLLQRRYLDGSKVSVFQSVEIILCRRFLRFCMVDRDVSVSCAIKYAPVARVNRFRGTAFSSFSFTSCMVYSTFHSPGEF
jgi:hypothetical protein